MKNENKKRKLSFETVFKYVALGIVCVYAIIMIIGNFVFQPMSMFWRSLNIFGTSGEFNIVIRIISYAIFFLGASWIIRTCIKFIEKFLHKGIALMDILCSLVKAAGYILLAFFILKTVGVDTSALLAGIGILGLVVGLGAQPLISDILAGFFIVIERLFEIGDIIVVDGFRGTVKEIGIRTTQIVDTGGNIKIINNSNLKSIVNMTNQLSLAICDIGIEYGESLERVESILKENLESVKEAIPAIKEGPFYKGVSELGDSAVVIRFAANCDEGDRYQVERDMNRQFKLLFDKNNINIPFPQIVLNQPTVFEKVTKNEQENAKTFVEEQKKLSKGLADGENTI